MSAYDPVAMAGAARMNSELHLVEDPYELADNADALLVCTEWNEFKQLDLARIKNSMRQPIMVDGRNLYEPRKDARIGLYLPGRGPGSKTYEWLLTH